EGDRVGQAVAGKVHGEQPETTELREQRRPDGGALRYAVEQDNRRAASVREYSYPQACPREVEEELLDVRADGGKQVPFRVVDAPLEVPGRPGLMVHGFSLRSEVSGVNRNHSGCPG